MSLKIKLIQIALGAVGSLVGALITHFTTGSAVEGAMFGPSANLLFGDVASRAFG